MNAVADHESPDAVPEVPAEVPAAMAARTTRAAKATLYVVATPIGNLGDLSPRARDILQSVDVVAAEDTRVTKRLLDHHGIRTRLLALHEHNEQRAANEVLRLLADGAAVALVSDAGTPGIADPGARLVARAHDEGYVVCPLPGANAAVTAVSASGFLSPHFLFYGFLPTRANARREALGTLVHLPYTVVFYEAPHRVAECLADLIVAFGTARRVLIARELTKLFEQTHRCTLGEAPAWLTADPHHTKGEFVLVVEGADASTPAADEVDKMLNVLLEELPLKQAVALAVKITGGNRNELYERALVLKRDR